MATPRYPDVPVSLDKRYQQFGELLFQQGDGNWDEIEYALNKIRPIIKAIQDAGGINIIVENQAQIGSLKWVIYNTVDTGWLLCDGRTLGSSSSGANLTGATYQPLYNVIWNAYATSSDLLSSAGGSTTKGLSAQADWDANKRIYLPRASGRVLCGSGQGSGLTNRVLGALAGAENGALPHDHGVGGIIIDPHNTTINITGSVTVDEFIGNASATAAVVIDPIPYSFAPTASVSINAIPYNIPISGAVNLSAYSPGGIVTVDAITIEFSDADNHTGTIAEAPPGHRHAVSVPAMTEKFTGDTTQPAAPGVYNTTDIQVQIDIDLAHAGTQVIIPTASFAGSPSAQTAAFVGNNAVGSLNATGSVTVDPFSGDLNATGSVTVDPIAIDHTHTAELSLDPYELELPHFVSGNTDVNNLAYGLVQPIFVANLLIKL